MWRIRIFFLYINILLIFIGNPQEDFNIKKYFFLSFFYILYTLYRAGITNLIVIFQKKKNPVYTGFEPFGQCSTDWAILTDTDKAAYFLRIVLIVKTTTFLKFPNKLKLGVPKRSWLVAYMTNAALILYTLYILSFQGLYIYIFF